LRFRVPHVRDANVRRYVQIPKLRPLFETVLTQFQALASTGA
jgi:hypothetical protein